MPTKNRMIKKSLRLRKNQLKRKSAKKKKKSNTKKIFFSEPKQWTNHQGGAPSLLDSVVSRLPVSVVSRLPVSFSRVSDTPGVSDKVIFFKNDQLDEDMIKKLIKEINKKNQEGIDVHQVIEIFPEAPKLAKYFHLYLSSKILTKESLGNYNDETEKGKKKGLKPLNTEQYNQLSGSEGWKYNTKIKAIKNTLGRQPMDYEKSYGEYFKKDPCGLCSYDIISKCRDVKTDQQIIEIIQTEIQERTHNPYTGSYRSKLTIAPSDEKDKEGYIKNQVALGNKNVIDDGDPYVEQFGDDWD